MIKGNEIQVHHCSSQSHLDVTIFKGSSYWLDTMLDKKYSDKMARNLICSTSPKYGLPRLSQAQALIQTSPRGYLRHPYWARWACNLPTTEHKCLYSPTPLTIHTALAWSNYTGDVNQRIFSLHHQMHYTSQHPYQARSACNLPTTEHYEF